MALEVLDFPAESYCPPDLTSNLQMDIVFAVFILAVVLIRYMSHQCCFEKTWVRRCLIS